MKDINKLLKEMKAHGMKVPEEKVFINILNAKYLTSKFLDDFISLEGKQAVWLNVYDEIVDWLTDNKGKGLFLHGKCGLGKTIMARNVIPAIILSERNKVIYCIDINDFRNKIDIVFGKKLISLDDVGTEEMHVNFGDKRIYFAELMDLVEKENKLIIITTNLTAEQLIAKYGDRVMDRIIATTRRIAFDGVSFRK